MVLKLVLSEHYPFVKDDFSYSEDDFVDVFFNDSLFCTQLPWILFHGSLDLALFLSQEFEVVDVFLENCAFADELGVQ